mmetsp:Transcript_17651/g.54756  ORF Transcript_17651/g.54756 Transcript_17651/m.54756 type:complete len:200 (-) Transcript_17651:1109-1708(-)
MRATCGRGSSSRHATATVVARWLATASAPLRAAAAASRCIWSPQRAERTSGVSSAVPAFLARLAMAVAASLYTPLKCVMAWTANSSPSVRPWTPGRPHVAAKRAISWCWPCIDTCGAAFLTTRNAPRSAGSSAGKSDGGNAETPATRRRMASVLAWAASRCVTAACCSCADTCMNCSARAMGIEPVAIAASCAPAASSA